jgi:hypothetical protein
MRTHRLRLSHAVGLVALSVCSPARADVGWLDLLDPRVAIGGGIEGKGPTGPNFEATVAPWPSLLGPFLSVGWSNPGDRTYTYGEIAGYFVLTAGIGGGSYTAEGRSVFRGHLFLGLPIPLFSVTTKGDVDPLFMAIGKSENPFFFLYLEPYWREEIERGPFGWQAELGLSLKMNFGWER